jgi:predicted DNA-binding protein (MmcQ/YjbR family)
VGHCFPFVGLPKNTPQGLLPARLTLKTPKFGIFPPGLLKFVFISTPFMSIEEIQTICNNLPAVTEDIKWEDHLCFNIGGKMFLVTSPDSVPSSASFKVPDEAFEVLASREGFMPAPYMARYKWVHLDNINRLSPREWKQHITDSYHLIAGKLPKKVRKELGLAD